MAVTGIDPATSQLMSVLSELATANATIRRQRRQLWGLVAALRAEQQSVCALTELIDVLLADDA